MCAHRAHTSEKRAPGRGNVRAGRRVSRPYDPNTSSSIDSGGGGGDLHQSVCVCEAKGPMSRPASIYILLTTVTSSVSPG